MEIFFLRSFIAFLRFGHSEEKYGGSLRSLHTSLSQRYSCAKYGPTQSTTNKFCNQGLWDRRKLNAHQLQNIGSMWEQR